MKEIKIEALAEERAAEVYIYDAIGDDGFGGGVTAKGFAERLNALGPLDTITVRINSPGGSAWDGTAIYNALVRNKAHKIMVVDGIAASAASLILMAGDERQISENATIMIHCASGLCYGPADEMDKTAVLLRKLDDQIAGTYASRTHRKPDTWLRLMQDETWYSAAEAVSERLADTIIPNKRAVAHFSPEVWGRISRRPDKIAAMLKGDAEPEGVLTDVFTPEARGDAAYIVEVTPAEPPIDIEAKLAEYAARVAEVTA